MHYTLNTSSPDLVRAIDIRFLILWLERAASSPDNKLYAIIVKFVVRPWLRMCSLSADSTSFDLLFGKRRTILSNRQLTKRCKLTMRCKYMYMKMQEIQRKHVPILLTSGRGGRERLVVNGTMRTLNLDFGSLKKKKWKNILNLDVSCVLILPVMREWCQVNWRGILWLVIQICNWSYFESVAGQHLKSAALLSNTLTADVPLFRVSFRIAHLLQLIIIIYCESLEWSHV